MTDDVDRIGQASQSFAARATGAVSGWESYGISQHTLFSYGWAQSRMPRAPSRFTAS
jgi:hypothetical protein